MDESAGRLVRLLRQNQTMDFASIKKAAHGRSRRSLFRDLAFLGYLTSFTHAGRYYTLADIPQFDDHGLWFHKSIGFSRAGTLKKALVKLIEAAEAGYTHRELKALLHIRVHNTLLSLVHEERINREYIEKLYVYVCIKTKRADEQMTRRREWLEAQVAVAPVAKLPIITVIEVLLELIRAGKVLIAPVVVVERLRVRGIPITMDEVEQIFARYGLEALKKTLQ
jgi:hypothetical protein